MQHFQKFCKMFKFFHMQCHQKKKILNKRRLPCTCNVIYLITCENCLEQYFGSAINFKNCFGIYKTDIKTNKNICGTEKHFNGLCKNNSNIFQFLSIQIIEQVCSCGTGKILTKPVIYYNSWHEQFDWPLLFQT